MCTRQRLHAHAHKLTIGQNVPRITSAQHVHTTMLTGTRAQARHWTECANGVLVHSMCTRQRLHAHVHKLTIGQNVLMDYECTACAHDNTCERTRSSSPLNVSMIYECTHVHTTKLTRNARAPTRTSTIGKDVRAHPHASSPLDRMCNGVCVHALDNAYVHTHPSTIGQNVPMVYEWNSMCTCQRLRTHAHKLTIGQNVPMICVHTHDNACVHTRTSSPLDRMCQ